MKKLGRWLPAVVWVALIFFVSDQSQLPTPGQRWLDLVVEKSAHTLEYVILAALFVFALDPARAGRKRAFWGAIFLAWVYALIDELHQSYVPGRSADWVDVAFDWMGAFIGALICVNLWAARRNDTLKERIQR